MSAPTPVNRKRQARERAIADGRIAGPQDRQTRRIGANGKLTPEEEAEQRRQEQQAKIDAADFTPLPSDYQEVEYDEETWSVCFVEFDTWTPRGGKGKYVQEEAPDVDEVLNEDMVMGEIENELLKVMDDEEYDRACDYCLEKYGRHSKRWFMGLLREIRKHPALGN